MADNIFKEAKQLLDNSNGRQFTDQDWKVLGAAMIPLNHPACPFPEDMTIAECLEELAKMGEDAHAGITVRVTKVEPLRQ